MHITFYKNKKYPNEMWLDILDRTRISLYKQKCKQRNFLANGADLIDIHETWLTK